MSDPDLDFSLRTALRSNRKDEGKVSLDTCPSDNILADYISDAISAEAEKEAISSHIANCDKCFKKVASCVSALSISDNNKQTTTSNRLLRRVLSMPKKYPKTNFKGSYIRRNKFLLVAGLFFALSFICKQFFLQFLAAALIFGVKWIMDTGSTKALIMIYETWKQAKTNDTDVDNKGSINKRRI